MPGSILNKFNALASIAINLYLLSSISKDGLSNYCARQNESDYFQFALCIPIIDGKIILTSCALL